MLVFIYCTHIDFRKYYAWCVGIAGELIRQQTGRLLEIVLDGDPTVLRRGAAAGIYVCV